MIIRGQSLEHLDTNTCFLHSIRFQGEDEESEDDADYAPDAGGGSDAESSSDSDEDEDDDSDDGSRKKSKKRSGSGSAKKGASKQVGWMHSSVCRKDARFGEYSGLSCIQMGGIVHVHQFRLDVALVLRCLVILLLYV